jgi:hypothetical protein
MFAVTGTHFKSMDPGDMYHGAGNATRQTTSTAAKVQGLCSAWLV